MEEVDQRVRQMIVQEIENNSENEQYLFRGLKSTELIQDINESIELL